jgi:hypothetical protein
MMFAKANDVEKRDVEAPSPTGENDVALGKWKRLRIKKPSLVREGGPLAVDE